MSKESQIGTYGPAVDAQSVTRELVQDSYGPSRAIGPLLLMASVGTVACTLLGRFALGLSEDSASASFAAYGRHPLPVFLTYSCGVIAGLLMLVTAPMLYLMIGGKGYWRLRVAALCQSVAGLLLVVSASRWLVVFPYLRKQYVDPSTGPVARTAIDVTYKALSYFLGITLGENLFAILTGTWTMLFALQCLRLRGKRDWPSWFGILGGAGWLLGSLEQLDFSRSSYFLAPLGLGPICWVIWTALLARRLRTANDVNAVRTDAPDGEADGTRSSSTDRAS